MPPYTSEEGFLAAIDRIVKPILDDFQPDIIINSAGQDNHYTDPITQMNFSAQGYAELTKRLKADIAVLEGGYAIEGALPYVNVGIILAMAGVDFTHVREPDYDPDKIRQKPEVSRWIDDIEKITLENWRRRHELKAKALDSGPFQERTRNIFYDTDNISEKQKETIRICPDCSGALKIDSASDRAGHILAIHIPGHACTHCRELAYQWYQSAEAAQFDAIFLQDRTTDKYLRRQE